MPKYTMEHGGKKYTLQSESPLSDADLQAAAQYFESPISRLGTIAGEELAKTPGRMLEGIKGVGQEIANPHLTTLMGLSVGKPPGAAMVPNLGQAILQGGARSAATGVGRAVDQPGDLGEKVAAGAKGAAGAALTETLLGSLPFLKVPRVTPNMREVAQRGEEKAADFARRQAAFANATAAPAREYAALDPRLRQAGPRLSVPTIDPTRLLTPREAADGLAQLRGRDYEDALKEIVREYNRVDRWRALGPGAGLQPGTAGTAFQSRVSPSRFDPQMTPLTGGEKFSQRSLDMIRNPALRMAADVEGSESGEYGIPKGAYPALGLAEVIENPMALYHLARRYVGH